jgi:multimeric flavodoxin WrbA
MKGDAMKVIALNGSPNLNGNTATALDRVCGALQKNGIETERVEIGKKAIHGCVGCGVCWEKQNRRCVYNDDVLNEVVDKLLDADGLLVGSPVYYAGINGALKCFLDRVFYLGSANGSAFRHKVGAGIVAVRRGGEVTAWDQLNKYFTISEMFVPSGHYWNMVFGAEPGEAAQDAEGMQCMEVLGNNMAWLLRAAEKEKASLPKEVEKEYTNFIR